MLPLKKMGIALIALVIFAGVVYFKHVNDLKVQAKEKEVASSRDIIVKNYASFVTMSDLYLGETGSMLTAPPKEMLAFFRTTILDLRQTNVTDSSVAIPLYESVYGKQAGDLIQTLNNNLAEFQINFYDALYQARSLQRTVGKSSSAQGKSGALGAGKAPAQGQLPSQREIFSLTYDLKHATSTPNLYNIETLYVTTKQTYGKARVLAFLKNLNQKLLSLNAELSAGD